MPGKRERVIKGLPEPPLRSIAIDDSAATMEALAQIDSRAIGFKREKHHRYLLGDPATTGVLLYAGGECVGYCYIGSGGHVGPLAVRKLDVLSDALVTALRMAADGPSGKISAFLSGTCESALQLAVAQGMRITFPMLLMASPGYEAWTQYLPRNPGFM
jgi:hypothetical protein